MVFDVKKGGKQGMAVTTVRESVSLDRELSENLEQYCKDTKLKKSTVMSIALEKYLEQEKLPHKKAKN